MNQKLQLIDFLKGFSIFTIIIGHFLPELPLPNVVKNIVQVGGTGVHTFILVSGFGLYLSYSRNHLSFPEFLKKRFTKIYLPYIFIVIITALLSFFIPVSNNSWYAFFGHVFLYKMFDDSIMSSYGYQFWFISTIIQLYLVFTLLAWLKSKLSPAIFFIVGLIASVCWMSIVLVFGKENNSVWTRFFLQYVWEFMLGMILAELYVRRGEMWKIKQAYLLITSAIGFILFGLLVLKMGEVGRSLDDIPAMFGYTSFAIFIYQMRVKIINRFFLFTGSISYALYLTHIIVLSIVSYIMHSFHNTFSLLIILIAVLFTYLISYFYNKLIVKYI